MTITKNDLTREWIEFPDGRAMTVSQSKWSALAAYVNPIDGGDYHWAIYDLTAHGRVCLDRGYEYTKAEAMYEAELYIEETALAEE